MPYAISHRNNKPVNIYFETHGNPENPAFMLHHGNGNAARDWKFLNYIDELAHDYYLILIDCFGYGNSDKSNHIHDYDINHRLKDSIAVLDACRLNNQVYFYGGSMGDS